MDGRDLEGQVRWFSCLVVRIIREASVQNLPWWSSGKCGFLWSDSETQTPEPACCEATMLADQPPGSQASARAVRFKTPVLSKRAKNACYMEYGEELQNAGPL